MAVCPSDRLPYPVAFCHPMRPLSRISWTWRSRCVGAASAPALGAAVERGGMTTSTGGSGLVVGHGPVDGLTIVRPVRDHRTEGARDLLEQRADLGGVALLVGGQLAGEDLASAALHREVQLPPGAFPTLALLLRQPFARAEDLQPGRIDHHVHRPATRPRLRQSLLYENVANLCSAEYQRAGPGRSRQRVVYDPRRIPDCRAWLTEKLGPLVHFAELQPEAEQSAESAVEVKPILPPPCRHNDDL